MNIKETIKNIRASCNNYVDPDLFAFIIDDDFHMGTNNISEIEGYGIKDDDSYEERLLKIHERENIFLPVGMMTFMPIINECDLFCEKDYNVKLTQEEFNDYIIGKTDVCNCSIDASFEKIEKSESEFYEKIEKIISEKII